MTITVEWKTGTETVGGTEWSMTTDTSFTSDADTTAGVFQPFIDFNALALGDVFEVAAYEKCRTGDTQRKIGHWTIADAQADPIWSVPALELGVGFDFTIKKVAGTDRTINWRISAVT